MDRTFSNKRLIPLDIVFSSSRLGDGSEALAPFADVPICVLEPLQKALECAQNGQPLPDEYFRLLAGEPTDTRAREQLTRELRRQLSPLARLVSRAQPTIDRIDRDRLVLADGHLQCAVAKARGKTWIKARMDDATAAAWDARPRAALDAVLGAQGRTATYTPIMHADYRKLKVSRSGTRRLDLMRQFLGPVHRRLSVLDIGCNTGYYAFHFYRQGFDAAGIDIDEEHLAVARALSELYSAPIPLELGRMQDFTPGKPFDVCLGLSVFWHMLGWGDLPQSVTPEVLCGKLDELVGHALFWEGGRRADEEIELIRTNTGLAHFTQLGRTHATGIADREFGVFTRIPPASLRAWLRTGADGEPGLEAA